MTQATNRHDADEPALHTVTGDTVVTIRDLTLPEDRREGDRTARLSECFPDPAECDFAELARLGEIRVGGGAAPLYRITVVRPVGHSPKGDGR